jgi:hypothetical protein
MKENNEPEYNENIKPFLAILTPIIVDIVNCRKEVCKIPYCEIEQRYEIVNINLNENPIYLN